MELYFADWAAIGDGLTYGDPELPRERRVKDGTPILVDGQMRPMEPWCSFLRLYSQNLSSNTVRSYARDALTFARFLDNRGVAILDAVERDLSAYCDDRLSTGISTRTLDRQLVFVRAFFTYLFETGQREELPWIRIASRSVVHREAPRTDLRIRSINRAQWRAFRNVGLGGELPSGEIDPSFRGRSTVRNMCGAEVAITTGMRLREWQSLLDVEVEEGASGAVVELHVAAKNSRRRNVYIPASTIKEIDLYRATERRQAVRSAQFTLRKNLHSLAVVREVDRAKRSLTYTVGGVERTYQLPSIPLAHRRILVMQDESGLIEPMSLFLGRGGTPPTARRWQQYFQTANSRVAQFHDYLTAMPAAITPHDLRHTFALVMLRSLQQQAANLERLRPVYRTGTISEHVSHNPLLTLQRLLGHSSPSTTMVYLRYIDESHELVQRAFEEWSDENLDYASYVADEILRTRDE